MPSINIANYNMRTQCPQIYIYIFAILTSALVTLKYGTIKQTAATLIGGGIVTFLLVGVNYCSWTFQWLTWIISALCILTAVGNILIFLVGPDDLADDSESEQTYKLVKV